MIYRLYPSPVRMPASWFVNVDKLNGTNKKGWKKKKKFRGLMLPSFKTSCGTTGIETPWNWQNRRRYMSGNRIQSPETHHPGLLMRNTSAISTEEPFYKTPVLKAVKVLKTREVGETAQPGGALRDKKTKCNVGS